MIVDTDYPDGLERRLSRYSQLEVLRGDFTSEAVRQRIEAVDVTYFFDVLLHQARPHWDEVLKMYSKITSCMVIYNQQFVQESETVRLTDLPLREYAKIAPAGREDVYRFVYDHGEEIHPTYGKRWKDMHNIFQWGITDKDLRRVMTGLGYREAFYRNYGPFSSSPAFENHGFVFVRT